MGGLSREDLVKQFPLAVMSVSEGYACPSCGRMVNHGQDKCFICDQTLSWDAVRNVTSGDGEQLVGSVSFNLPSDFAKGNCRKCPISYIVKDADENRYTCPLAGKHQENCPMEIKRVKVE